MNARQSAVAVLVSFLLATGPVAPSFASADGEAPVKPPTDPAPITLPDPTIRIAAIGDSITAWQPPYRGDPGSTWVTTAARGDIELVGGWARSSANLTDMERNLQPAEADVLVMLVGTNNLPRTDGRVGTSLRAKFAALDELIGTMTTEHVILVAVPPFYYGYKGALSWNKNLQRYATEHGHTFIDPWTKFRDANGRWKPGASRPDKVHPAPATAAAVGKIIAAKIREVAK